jgi:glycosyltransferase involved in cell wall biosynthesis
MNNSAIINTCDWGSTGKIAKGLLQYLKSQGKNVLFCYGRGEKRDDNEFYRFCSKMDVNLHFANTKLTGRLNSSSKCATKRLIGRLRQNNIKEIYIVNLHGYVLNEQMFLEYLVKDDIHVVYIMADESAFLGNCTYRLGCEEYKKECSKCREIKGIANILCSQASNKAYLVKRKYYEQMRNIVFVGPEFVIIGAKTSPLMDGKRMEIVDEAIDVKANTPKNTSALRKELGIKEEQIIIGCVAPFSYPRKGVKYLVEAAKRLENNERFVFVQVGYDVKDKSGLPKNYIPIGYVNGQEQLTEYYSLSDLFVFPSIQDTMPNACLEALACGSPLLCFNTSGMPYMADETVMTLVEATNVDQMVEVIRQTQKKDESIINTCRNYALKRFDNQKYFKRLETIMNSMNY